jgi:hypothetical protein
LLAVSAGAFTFEQGHSEADGDDYIGLYDYLGTPKNFASAGMVVNDRLTMIYNTVALYSTADFETDPTDAPYWTQSASPFSQLTGLVYDLKVGALGTRPGGDTFAYIVGEDRYDVPGPGGSVYTDGRFDFWEDSGSLANTGFDRTGSTGGAGNYSADWGFTATGGLGAGWWTPTAFDAGEYDTFPSVSDGSPQFSGTLLPQPAAILALFPNPGVGVVPANTVMIVNVTQGQMAATPSGNVVPAWLHVTENHTAPGFALHTGKPGDVLPIGVPHIRYVSSLTSTNDPQPKGWDMHSLDDLTFRTPEPNSVVLLGSGVIGLVGYCFRRRMGKNRK